MSQVHRSRDLARPVLAIGDNGAFARRVDPFIPAGVCGERSLLFALLGDQIDPSATGQQPARACLRCQLFGTNAAAMVLEI